MAVLAFLAVSSSGSSSRDLIARKRWIGMNIFLYFLLCCRECFSIFDFGEVFLKNNQNQSLTAKNVEISAPINTFGKKGGKSKHHADFRLKGLNF